jgi:NAD(P)-dependent dehydrogenase (short-subunit alcohol dehydrogenase family)
MRLEGKVAVITGGGGGIGEAICRLFAEEGAAVAVADIDGQAARRVADSLPSSGAWCVDVTRREQVESMAGDVERLLGPIDVWVNNAGVSRIVPFLQCTDEIWEKVIQVNLRGTFLGCQTAIRAMRPRKRGAIINMSSQSGKAGNSQYAAYCASKFAVIGLTQSIALEFAADGVRVNALCPGVVLTPLWSAQIGEYAAKHGIRQEEVPEYIAGKIPLGRLCQPVEVARAALFLAGDESSYITGQALNVSGGSVFY